MKLAGLLLLVAILITGCATSEKKNELWTVEDLSSTNEYTYIISTNAWTTKLMIGHSEAIEYLKLVEDDTFYVNSINCDMKKFIVIHNGVTNRYILCNGIFIEVDVPKKSEFKINFDPNAPAINEDDKFSYH